VPGQKQKNRIFPFALILIGLSALLCGCGGGQPQKKPPAEAGGEKINIAVSLADMERDGNQVIKKTMSDRQGQVGRQGQAGRQVNIVWLDAKNDPAQQEKDLDQLANQKVKAVVLQPADASAGPGLVRKLAQANIKVIVLDTLPADSPVDGYIASDHARTGELQARYLASMVRGRSAPLKVVVLQGDRNDQASREITSSLLENLRANAMIQVVLVKDHPGGDPQAATATLAQALTSAAGRIDAVVATDSRLAAAAAEILKSRGLNDRVITIGVGAGQKASKALADGEHDAEVDIMPEMMAQYAYDAAVGLASTGHWEYDRQVGNGNFDVPAKITPVRLITRDESYLLEQRWGKLAGQGGNQAGGGSGSSSGSNGGSSSGGGAGGKGEGKKTTVRITTKEGKTVEMQIDGEIKKIETLDGTGGGSGGGEGGGAGGAGGG